MELWKTTGRQFGWSRTERPSCSAKLSQISCSRKYPENYVRELQIFNLSCIRLIHLYQNRLRVEVSKTEQQPTWKTLRSLWILRALISLKSVIMTKVLKTMVKCSDALPSADLSLPFRMSNSRSPVKDNQRFSSKVFYAKETKYCILYLQYVREHHFSDTVTQRPCKCMW